jgi:endonuclease G
MPSREELVAKYVSHVAQKRDISTLLRAQVGGEEAAMSPEKIEQHRQASEGVREILKGRLPTSTQSSNLEAIILPKIRPVLDIVDGDFHTDHPLWQKLNDDAGVRDRLKKAIPSIGRLELPGNPDYPYGGTGFVVGDGIVMTNRHVAEIFSSGLGSKKLSFRPGLRAGIDFEHELDRPPGATFSVRTILMIHPYWDMALLAVEELPDAVKPLSLTLRDFPSSPIAEVAAIGYPAFDYRNDAAEQNDLFRDVFGVKRLLPGTLGGRQDTESFGKMVPALRHNCSTLGGNSGSAIIDLERGEVVALHFGGQFHQTNFGVPTCELARDGRVVDAGVHFTDEPLGGVAPWNKWWADADESIQPVLGEMARAGDVDGSSNLQKPFSSSRPSASTNALDNRELRITVPLQITISIGEQSGEKQMADVTPAGTTTAAGTEALAAPWHDTKYASRHGYDEHFLKPAPDVPMPEAEDPDILAKTKDGKTELRYQNFSILMHAQRRLALITASNVTAETKLKKPEPGKDYSRRGLSGLGPNDQELWFVDSRLDDGYQLSDFFYTRDDGAFDKGHIVRRDDVAWGKTYNLLRRADGDTYHVTNCSPQIAGFNRSNLGEDNWGDLENHVLKSAAAERYCQFAGPVLDPSDAVFVGKIAKGKLLKVKIPSRFWKVIVSTTAHGIASYGFLLEQDLSAVPTEFVVPANFRRLMVPLTDLQKLAGIKFDADVLHADQYETDEGLELTFRAGLKRRSMTESTPPVLRGDN